jgi:hypothetical protein
MGKAGLISILLVFSAGARAQSPSEDAASSPPSGKKNFLILPALGYTPETRFIGGVVGGYFWQSEDTLRKSSVSGQFFYSQNKQVQTGISCEIFSDSGRSRFTGETIYSYWPGKFYGVGNQTPLAGEEPFVEKFLRSTFGLFLSVWPGLSIGPEYELRISSVVETSDAGALRTGRIGGVENYVASGLGIAAVFDTRDDNFVPQKGCFVYLSGRCYARAFGSDYSFAAYTLDAREYFPVYGTHLLCFQSYIRAISGPAPFQMLSLLGGDVRGRGYYSGRYRDNVLVSGQLEYRTPLLFRCGLVLFGGITQVSERFAGLALREMHPYAGFGIRFRLLRDTRVNVRFDWGYGDNSDGNYIGVNEAF